MQILKFKIFCSYEVLCNYNVIKSIVKLALKPLFGEFKTQKHRVTVTRTTERWKRGDKTGERGRETRERVQRTGERGVEGGMIIIQFLDNIAMSAGYHCLGHQ